jgi:hypothetical protein
MGAHVPDILRDAGPEVRHSVHAGTVSGLTVAKGLHISEIAARSGSGVDSAKLGTDARSRYSMQS